MKSKFEKIFEIILEDGYDKIPFSSIRDLEDMNNHFEQLAALCKQTHVEMPATKSTENKKRK